MTGRAVDEIRRLVDDDARPKARTPPDQSEQQGEKTCPQCGRPMVIKPGRYGRFWSCTGYPNACRGMLPI